MNAIQVRVARPTDKLGEVVAFYKYGLGLVELGSFEKHEGYDGIMLGLPDSKLHLEFTHHLEGSPCPAPTKDNLMVLYFGKVDDYQKAIAQIERFGCKVVDPENPYWKGRSQTYEDPDGWRVVLYNGTYTASK